MSGLMISGGGGGELKQALLQSYIVYKEILQKSISLITGNALEHKTLCMHIIAD